MKSVTFHVFSFVVSLHYLTYPQPLVKFTPSVPSEETPPLQTRLWTSYSSVSTYFSTPSRKVRLPCRSRRRGSVPPQTIKNYSLSTIHTESVLITLHNPHSSQSHPHPVRPGTNTGTPFSTLKKTLIIRTPSQNLYLYCTKVVTIERTEGR